MRTRTLKSLAAVALTGAASALVVGFRTSDPPVITTTSAVSGGAVATPSSIGSASASAAPSNASTPAASAGSGGPSTAAYADGTWNGSVVQEPWGDFQIAVVITGGKVTDVKVVASPTDGHSNRINSRAVPALTESTIASQDATVDLVSGATWTSESYATSLQAALDAAKAASAKAG